jgi:hypothetical protein
VANAARWSTPSRDCFEALTVTAMRKVRKLNRGRIRLRLRRS